MKKLYYNLFSGLCFPAHFLTSRWFVFVCAMTLSYSLFAQEGLINDDFSQQGTANWSASTSGASSALEGGQLVITMALQSSGKYRGDVRRNSGAVIHAGNYPILAVKFNKPPKCNFFLDTNFGAYNNRNNNHKVIQTPSGNIYYWDFSAGTLGSTTLSHEQTTQLSLLQLKVADVELTEEELAANDIDYEMDWVRTYASMEDLRNDTQTNLPDAGNFAGPFSHPGLLHSTEDLTRIKGFVDNQYGRPFDSYQLLASNSKSSYDYVMTGPFTYLTRDNQVTVDGVNGGTVKNRVESDFLAAYYNALMWNITDNELHAQKAVEIIDAYTNTTEGIIGRDAELNGLYGFIFTNAAELMRYTYSGWSETQAEATETMLKNVFYPVLQDFKSCSHGNWDHSCMKALMAIAVFSEDYDMFNKVIQYFYYGEGNGSIDNYVLTPEGQLQESNRDQPHTMLALGSLAEIAEVAFKQGLDLYSASNNAINRGFEYTAKYNLGYEVPFETQYDYCEWNYQDYTPEAISPVGRGQLRAVFEIAYNHYVYRSGVDMPYVLEVLGEMGPEGAPFGADNPGYGSLLFYLNDEPNHPVATQEIDPEAGLIDDNFDTSSDGWTVSTSGTSLNVQDGQLKVDMVKLSNGKYRGDIKKPDGATLYPTNFPILAIKMTRPGDANITFDTNLGAYRNGSNRWTGKLGEDVYYYDLVESGFGSGPTYLSSETPTTLTTFQFKVADVTTGDSTYTVDWVKTFKSLEELELFLLEPQTITFEAIGPRNLEDQYFEPTAYSSSGLPLTFSSSDTTVAKIVDGKVQLLAYGTAEITAYQEGDSEYATAEPVSQILYVIDPEAGLIDDNFDSSSDGWAIATGGAFLNVQDGQLQVDMVKLSNGKHRGDIKKTDGATLYPTNFPIVAVKMTRPGNANITFDTNLGAYRNGSNRWTGIFGEDVYYYDLVESGFGSGPTYLSSFTPTELTTFQFKVADVTTGDSTYTVDWVKTFTSIEELKEFIKLEQTITFEPIDPKKLGDLPFDPEAISSSGLPVSLRSSNEEVAIIEDGKIKIIGVGSTEITATQKGDYSYKQAEPVIQVLNVAPFNVSVLFKDGLYGQGNSKQISPYFQILNEDEEYIAYQELEVRYWLTPENYSGLNLWVDYAQIGADEVTMEYVPLDQSHVNAFGYVSYQFLGLQDTLMSNTNSGEIRSNIANADWRDLEKENDFSYKPAGEYSPNSNITIYRNGTLIYGSEPEQVPISTQVRVLSKRNRKNTNSNEISLSLLVNNEGNVRVDYKGITVRYWFTSEGHTSLTHHIDYAALGAEHTTGKFVQVDPAKEGANVYFELGIDEALNQLMPLSSTGEIELRINKNDWSKFNEEDDYSLLLSNEFEVNDRITVNYYGELIFGNGPDGTLSSTSSSSSEMEISYSIYPNPVQDLLTVERSLAAENVVSINIYNSSGEIKISSELLGTSCQLNVSSLAKGIYILKIVDDGDVVTRKLMKK